MTHAEEDWLAVAQGKWCLYHGKFESDAPNPKCPTCAGKRN